MGKFLWTVVITMQYTLDDLRNKVDQFKNGHSEQLLKEIEGILSDIRNNDSMIYYHSRELTNVLVRLNKYCPPSGFGNIPNLVSAICNKLLEHHKTSAGSTAAEGQNIVRKSAHDPLSMSKILSKLNYVLWKFHR